MEKSGPLKNRVLQDRGFRFEILNDGDEPISKGRFRVYFLLDFGRLALKDKNHMGLD